MDTNILKIDSEGFGNLQDVHCVLGVDEAGRGPVLGPMVYGICAVETVRAEELKNELEVDDSKQLSEDQRDHIFEKIQGEVGKKWLAYSLEVISAQYISTCMLGRVKTSLNEISHNSAMVLIQRCLDAGMVVDHVYLDTVGPPESYQAKLQVNFPQLKFTVSKKADALYPVVGAASICAKVTRDRAIKNWVFHESVKVPDEGIGSGYPGDPKTKNFLAHSLHPVFGFSSIVRFSWETCQNILDKKGVEVAWEDDDEGSKGPATKRSRSLFEFFGKGTEGPIPISKHTYFVERNLKTPLTFL